MKAGVYYGKLYKYLLRQFNRLNRELMTTKDKKNDVENELLSLKNDLTALVFDESIPVEIKIKIRDVAKKSEKLNEKNRKKYE